MLIFHRWILADLFDMQSLDTAFIASKYSLSMLIATSHFLFVPPTLSLPFLLNIECVNQYL